ncbi:MAG: GDSL-type esterase/lipase family protein [Candidatus Paceibacterota bacterium]
MHTNIFIFGDSMAFGCWDAAGGWVQRLNNFLVERFLSNGGKEFYIYNLSISGNQTQDIIARMEPELMPRQSEGGANIIIFAIGVNDSAFVHSKNDHWVPFREFEDNLRELIRIAKKFSGKIFFLGLPIIDQEIVNPMPWDTDKSYRNGYVKKYDQSLQTTAKENSIGYIPLFEKLEASGYKKLLHDGAHPNSAGHELIFETVRDYLLGNKII